MCCRVRSRGVDFIILSVSCKRCLVNLLHRYVGMRVTFDPQSVFQFSTVSQSHMVVEFGAANFLFICVEIKRVLRSFVCRSRRKERIALCGKTCCRSHGFGSWVFDHSSGGVHQHVPQSKQSVVFGQSQPALAEASQTPLSAVPGWSGHPLWLAPPAGSTLYFVSRVFSTKHVRQHFRATGSPGIPHRYSIFLQA